MSKYVYFVKKKNGLIKIGFSGDIQTRKRMLEREHGELEIVGIIKGGIQKEKELHNKFASTRVEGEWFKSSQSLLDYITSSKMIDINDISYSPYKSIYISDEILWQQIKEKLERPDINRSISQIIIRLLEMWLNGEVLPYPENDANEQR